MLVLTWMVFGLFLSACAVPNFQECMSVVSKSLPYCNEKLSFEERVEFLLEKLTLEEKIGIMGPDPKCKDDAVCLCTTRTASASSVGLGSYVWLVETNTGVNSGCVKEAHCATTFSGPVGLAASFNRTLWYAKGDVISTEMRAFSNSGGTRYTPGSAYPIGLTGFGPNINLAAHPLWGRNSEVPSEDPTLAGQYAIAYTKGMQQIDSKGYYKMRSYLKHYTAYEIEFNRVNADYEISNYDFFDSFLPQYYAGLVVGGSSGAMCSYVSENGTPSCSNPFLLNELVRKRWNRSDAVITSDCGALSSQFGPPMKSATSREIVERSLNAGLDIEMGSLEFSHGMSDAVNHGILSMETINESLRRNLMQMMSVGRFDFNVSWTNIPFSAINSTLHQQIKQEAAAQSLVCLKNDKNIIPVKQGTNIAVVGPQGIGQFSLLSDYFGDEVCFGGTFDCIPTIASEIAKLNVGGHTFIQKGVDINSTDSSGIQAALDAVNASDVTFLVLGIDRTIEHEGVDRENTTLPGLQYEFALQVLKTGKPVILVLINGGIISIDGLIDPSAGIIEAFNLAFGAPAFAKAVFGQTTTAWGKLPVTIYPAIYSSQINGRSMNMTESPGRTYRYYTGTPLFPFGFGINPLTTFEHSCSIFEEQTNFSLSCVISNTGNVDADEVLLVYHSAGSEIRSRVTHPIPIKSLRDFERLQVESKAQTKQTWNFVKDEFFGLLNEQGQTQIYSGRHYIIISRGDPQNDIKITMTL